MTRRQLTLRRYGARLRELREQGHVIESRRIRDGAFLYTLTFDAERDTGTPGRSEGSLGSSSGMASTPGAGVALDADAPPSASGGETQAPFPSPGVVESHPQPLFEMPVVRPGLYDPDRAVA